MPTMMLTAGKDPVLLPSFTKGMEDSVRNKSIDTVIWAINGYWKLIWYLLFINWRCQTWPGDTSKSVDTGHRWKSRQRPTKSWYPGLKRRTRRLKVVLWLPNCEEGRKEGRILTRFSMWHIKVYLKQFRHSQAVLTVNEPPMKNVFRQKLMCNQQGGKCSAKTGKNCTTSNKNKKYHSSR